jgi:hypothetical protein
MLAQSIGIAASGLAAWLMIAAGSSKNMMQLRAPAHCAACGRRLVRGRCRCTGHGD